MEYLVDFFFGNFLGKIWNFGFANHFLHAELFSSRYDG